MGSYGCFRETSIEFCLVDFTCVLNDLVQCILR